MKTVKTLKYKTSLFLRCDGSNNLLTGDNMWSQVKAMEQKLQIESSELKNETLTNEELKTAAEMFLYLTMCPNDIKPWLRFYKNLFQTQTPNQIILTLNRIMKGTKTKTAETEKFANIAETLFESMKKEIFPGMATLQVGKSEGEYDDEYLLSNHPVHIMTKDNQMSPSAFIPCDSVTLEETCQQWESRLTNSINQSATVFRLKL